MSAGSEKQQVQTTVDVPATVPYEGKGNVAMLDDPRDASREKLEKIDNGVEEEGSVGSDEEKKEAVQIPWKYRLTAIILIILFGTGNTYAGFVLGPLKTRLVRKLKISSESLRDVLCGD